MDNMILQLFGIYLALFCNSMAFTVIYPFGSLMIQEFGVSSDKSSTGFWVGVLAFSMMLGRVLGSPIWGMVSDKFGRKSVALIGISTIIVFSICFGMSSNLPMALASRFCLGFFSCVGLTANVIVSDLTSSNPSYMAWLGITWQMGSIAGNIVGGFFPGLFFSDYEFLAPNSIVSSLALVSFLFASVFLKETLKKPDEMALEFDSRNFSAMLKDKSVQLLCLVYLVVYTNASGFYELISLWCWADIQNGGFEMSIDQIGNVLAFSAILLVCTEALIYKVLRKYMNILTMTKWTLLFSSVVFLIFPLCSLFRFTSHLKYFVLAFFCILWLLCSFILGTNLVIFANNSVSHNEKGKMNAIIVFFMSAANGLGPLISGTTFQLTVTSSLPVPLKNGCPFFIMSILCLVAFCIMKNERFKLFMIPKSKSQLLVE